MSIVFCLAPFKSAGGKTYLGRGATFTLEQKQALADRIKTLANLFYRLNAIEVRRVAFHYAERKKIPHRFSESEPLSSKRLLYGFLERNSKRQVIIE